MKIKLNEIPTEGEQFNYTRQSAELNAGLADLLGQNDYKIDIYLRPLNTKDFSLTGLIKTKCEQECSRCGDSFALPIEKKLNEILIPGRVNDRQDKYAKSHVLPSGESEDVSVYEYHHQQFDMAEFLHESIALELPFVSHCELCGQNKEAAPLIYDEKMGEDTKPNPFQALKGLKLN